MYEFLTTVDCLRTDNVEFQILKLNFQTQER